MAANRCDNYSMNWRDGPANGLPSEVNGPRRIQNIKAAIDCHWLLENDRSTRGASGSLAIDCHISSTALRLLAWISMTVSGADRILS
jgi:hypothetical protein